MAKEKRVSKTELLMQAAGLAAAVLDDQSPITNISFGAFGGVLEMLGSVRELKLRSGSVEVVDNPRFVESGIGGESPTTKSYLFSRKWKSVGSSALGVAGAATSAAAAMASHDAIGAAQHANATASTTIHFVRLVAIAEHYKGAAQIAEWMKIILGLKATKAGLRATQFAGAITPGINMGAGIAGAIVKGGVGASMKPMCFAAAQEIHWYADQEQQKGGGAKAGPASAITWEVMSRKSALRLMGKYNIAELVSEPAGWMATGDKLLML